MTDTVANGSYGSPEGVQTTVTTVPKHIADGLAEALADISRHAENPNINHVDYRIEAKIAAETNLEAYRKATQ